MPYPSIGARKLTVLKCNFRQIARIEFTLVHYVSAAGADSHRRNLRRSACLSIGENQREKFTSEPELVYLPQW